MPTFWGWIGILLAASALFAGLCWVLAKTKGGA